MTAVEGFGGIALEDGKLVCHPSLPDGITGMRFHVYYQGQEYEVKIEGANGTVTVI